MSLRPVAEVRTQGQERQDTDGWTVIAQEAEQLQRGRNCSKKLSGLRSFCAGASTRSQRSATRPNSSIGLDDAQPGPYRPLRIIFVHQGVAEVDEQAIPRVSYQKT